MDLFNQLALITEEWLSVPLKIQALLAKGKFDLVMGNYDSYESILELIKSLADEYELTQYRQMIDKEIITFNTELHKWKTILAQNSLKERIERAELENYFKDASSIVKLNKI